MRLNITLYAHGILLYTLNSDTTLENLSCYTTISWHICKSMPYIPIRNSINAKEVRKSLYYAYGANLNFNAVSRISLFWDSVFGSHVTLLEQGKQRCMTHYFISPKCTFHRATEYYDKWGKHCTFRLPWVRSFCKTFCKDRSCNSPNLFLHWTQKYLRSALICITHIHSGIWRHVVW